MNAVFSITTIFSVTMACLAFTMITSMFVVSHNACQQPEAIKVFACSKNKPLIIRGTPIFQSR
jgi:hypothetical protein